jgi:hypothetical protein
MHEIYLCQAFVHLWIQQSAETQNDWSNILLEFVTSIVLCFFWDTLYSRVYTKGLTFTCTPEIHLLPN